MRCSAFFFVLFSNHKHFSPWSLHRLHVFTSSSYIRDRRRVDIMGLVPPYLFKLSILLLPKLHSWKTSSSGRGLSFSLALTQGSFWVRTVLRLVLTSCDQAGPSPSGGTLQAAESSTFCQSANINFVRIKNAKCLSHAVQGHIYHSHCQGNTEN